jgi:hypothetical protein
VRPSKPAPGRFCWVARVPPGTLIGIIFGAGIVGYIHHPYFLMRIILLLVAALSLLTCTPSPVTPAEGGFVPEPTVSPILAGTVDEASGMVDSRTQAGALWVEQDSGNPAELALLGQDGKLRGKLPIPGTTNRDWEDLASGPGPTAGLNYLYIAEIGDNNAQYPSVAIYRLPEPASLNAAVGPVEKINFVYPDGPRDAEALFCDPLTRDLWIVSKRESKVRLYRLAYPQSTTATITAEAFGELPYSVVTGAGISPDGLEIVIRTYFGVFHWTRTATTGIADALQRTVATTLPFHSEPQGEAVCFERANKGYFTASERANASSTSLYYFARK